METPGKSASVSVPMLGGIAAAVALGWLAAKLNVAGYAPVALLPLAIGVALGAVISWLTATAGVFHPRQLILAAAGLAILTVLAEHAWLYRDFCRQWREARANQAQVAMFRPEAPWSPREYFANEATTGRVTLWCVDAALVVAAAVTTATVRQRWSTNRITTLNPEP